jgi:hypothetical protein
MIKDELSPLSPVVVSATLLPLTEAAINQHVQVFNRAHRLQFRIAGEERSHLIPHLGRRRRKRVAARSRARAQAAL